MSVFCAKCGHKLLKASAYCDKCGTETLNKVTTPKEDHPKPVKGWKRVLYILNTPFRFIWRQKRYIAFSLLLLFSVSAVGAAGYNQYKQPSIVEKKVKQYFEAHKEELKGDRGYTGFTGRTGASGQDGSDGANGSNASNSFRCTSYDIGSSTYTNCR